MKYALFFLVTVIIFAATDYLWITKLSWNFYQDGVGHLFATKFKAIPAVIFYLIYIAGMFYFAVIPGVHMGSMKFALFNGAFLGFIAYATYDLTNMSTLPGWPAAITIADIAWGTFLTGTISALAVYFSRFYFVLL